MRVEGKVAVSVCVRVRPCALSDSPTGKHQPLWARLLPGSSAGSQNTHLISPFHQQFLLSWMDKVWKGIVGVKLRLLSEALSLGLLGDVQRGEGGAGEGLEYPA